MNTFAEAPLDKDPSMTVPNEIICCIGEYVDAHLALFFTEALLLALEGRCAGSQCILQSLLNVCLALPLFLDFLPQILDTYNTAAIRTSRKKTSLKTQGQTSARFR